VARDITRRSTGAGSGAGKRRRFGRNQGPILILEFFKDVAPDANPGFHRDANRRAEQKYWLDHTGKRITPYAYRFLKATEAGEYRDDSRYRMLGALSMLIEAMDPAGPFFSGAAPGAVDIVLAPFAYRIDVLLGAYRDFSLPENGEGWNHYRRW